MIDLNNIDIQYDSTDSSSQEILRNVKNILTTTEGTVPYDRGFGISVDVLDQPVNEVKGLYLMECITKIRKYEPRVSVVSVDFNDDGQGRLYPKVVLGDAEQFA